MFWGGKVWGQCSTCDVTISNNGITPTINNGDIVCVNFNRSNPIDLQNSNNVIICIPSGRTFSGGFSNYITTNRIRINVYGVFRGDLTLDRNNSEFNVFPGGQYNNNGTLTLTRGQLNNQGTITRPIAIENRGIYTNSGTQTGNVTLSANNSNYIITSSGIQSNGTVTVTNGSFINQGVNSRTTLLLNSSTYDNSGTQSGQVTVADNSQYTNSANQSGVVYVVNNGNYQNNGTQSNTVDIGGTATYTNNNIHNGNVALTTNGIYSNTGVQTGNLTINNGTSATNSGTLNLSSLNFDTNNSGMVFNNTSSSILNVTNSTSMSGTVTLNGTSTFSNNLTFTTNNGVTNVAISGNANLSVAGTLSLARNSNVNITNPSALSPGPIINANSLTFPNDGGSTVRQLNIGANSTVSIALDTDVDTGNAQINLAGSLETRDLLIKNNGGASPVRLVMTGDSELIVNRDAIINRDITTTDNAQISITRDLNLQNSGSYSLTISGNTSLDVGRNTTLNRPMQVSGTSSVNLAGNLTLPNVGGSELVINDDVNFTVGGNTSVEGPIRMNNNAYVTFNGNVNLPNVGGAQFIVNDNADILITSNLTKSGGNIIVGGTGQLVICDQRLPSGSITGSYPASSSSGVSIGASPAYYGGCRILPVEFLSFNATYQTQTRSTLLDWSTAKEWENSHFEIERAVNSVKEWETIGRVEGNGYSEAPVEYSFTDTELPLTGGNIFYRLKQVDFSGKFSYSRTRAIQVDPIDSKSVWLAYPNPSNIGSEISVALLRFNDYHDELISLRLIYMLGESQSTLLFSPDNISEVVSGWLLTKKAGIYILDIRWGTNSQQIKLLRK
jgi:hypothetical protein